jgi:tRNA-specific 2-thiouridylase
VEEEFGRDVVDDFVSEYANGRTPNPCVRCNSNTKFRDLLGRARALGCDAIATGHYVRIEQPEVGEPRLLRGRDTGKDQAYFLWGLPRTLLSSLRFPLGELTKPEVRDRARRMGLATADKPESQEICFVPTGDYRGFLERKLPTLHAALRPGPLVTSSGRVVGEHSGYAGFTVGQRKGLGGGFEEPHFVLEVRPGTREVVVGPREELHAEGLTVGEVSWLTDSPPSVGARVAVQIRHRAPGASATITELGPELAMRFDAPQVAVTPGQSAAVFLGDRLLGGGRIVRALRRVPVDGPVERGPLRA